MKRFEKYGDVTVRTITFIPRALIGLGISIKKNMPDKLEFPFELKKKEAGNGKERTSN